jgi:hypothetical protein
MRFFSENRIISQKIVVKNERDIGDKKDFSMLYKAIYGPENATLTA